MTPREAFTRARGVSILAAWLLFACLVLTIASVPQFRSPWSETVRVHETSPGVFVSEPITPLETPYISFARIRFPVGASVPPEARLQVVMVSGSRAARSAEEVHAQELAKADANAAAGAGGFEYEARLPTAVQFRPSGVVRVAALVNPPPTEESSQRFAAVTVGYDGTSPAVTIIHYWWPWMGGAFVVATLLLYSPIGRQLQLKAADGLARIRTHQPVLWLLLVATMIRYALVVRGGQYFDLDEVRYGTGTIRIFDLLSTGNVVSAFHALLDSPDHPGFRIVGLIPAFFQTLSAWGTGHPLSDLRHPSGEWLAAFALSTSAVCSIAMTYLVAHRTGASRNESTLAAFLMFASSSMLMYGRHFFPYDAAMAVLLMSLWVGLKDGDNPLRSYAVGLVAGFGFLTYEGYWLMTGAVGLMHILQKPFAARLAVRRAILFGAGLVTLPAFFVLSGQWTGRPFLEGTRAFSTTVVHGDFGEGWSLPWKYLWDIERGLLCVYVAGVIAPIYGFLTTPRDTTKRGLMWLLPAGAIYAGLVVGSNVFHRFVVYDRLARQMLPFLCLATAAGLTGLMGGWFKGRRAWLAYGVITFLFFLNAWPLMTQRFPREIAQEAIRQFGAANVRIGTTVLRSLDEPSQTFLPIELHQPAPDGHRKRYVLLNAKDIWIEGGVPGLIPAPEGRVVLTARHPRQLRGLQYHGYTPRERAVLRKMDLSIQLIDTGPTETGP